MESYKPEDLKSNPQEILSNINFEEYVLYPLLSIESDVSIKDNNQPYDININPNNKQLYNIPTKKESPSLDVARTIDAVEKAHSYAERSEIMKAFISPENHVNGDYKQFHELVQKLVKCKEYTWAAAVLTTKFGEKVFNDPDLLADTILVFDFIQEPDHSIDKHLAQCYKRAAELGIKGEATDNLYEKIIDHMQKNIAKNHNPDSITLTKMLIGKYREVSPRNEGGLFQEASLYEVIGQKEEAIKVLGKGILEDCIDKSDSELEMRCPRCCQKLIQLQSNVNDYELIAKIGWKGLEYATADGNEELMKWFRKVIKQAEDALRLKHESEARLKQMKEKDEFILKTRTVKKIEEEEYLWRKENFINRHCWKV